MSCELHLYFGKGLLVSMISYLYEEDPPGLFVMGILVGDDDFCIFLVLLLTGDCLDYVGEFREFFTLVEYRMNVIQFLS